MIYPIPLYVLGSTLIWVRGYWNKILKRDILYEKLRISRKADKPLISEPVEDKLKQIIVFLRENYRSDISREGLAGAMDMNTDYMSRQFKKYTGEKINDYVTRLRIEDAAARLKEKNTRILDIAMAVGFESLSTFNRAFKAVIGMRPAEYRSEQCSQE